MEERKMKQWLFVQGDRCTVDQHIYKPEDTLLICDHEETAQCYMQEGYAVLGYARGRGELTGLPYIIEETENLADISEEYYEQVFRRLHHLPWTILTTERCIIREITVEDVDRLYELYADPKITQYMEPLFTEPEDEKEYTSQYIHNIYELYEFGMWIIERREDHLIIGRAGVEQNEGMEGLELGFMLGTDYQQQGYAYEACHAIVQYAHDKLGAAVLSAAVVPENIASVRLCDKLGFFPEGRFYKGGTEYIRYVKRCR